MSFWYMPQLSMSSMYSFVRSEKPSQAASNFRTSSMVNISIFAGAEWLKRNRRDRMFPGNGINRSSARRLMNCLAVIMSV